MSSSPTETARSSLESRRMPQMGVSVAEGTIVEWRKRPGDWVEADETVCDVTTDKIDVEIPSPATGRLERILVEPGDTVAVGTPSPRSTPRRARARRTPTSTTADDSRKASGPPPPQPSRRRRTAIAPASTRRSSGGSPTSTASTSLRSSGTGIGGRVRKKDVLAYIEAREGVRPRLRSRPPHRVALPAEEVEAPQSSEAGTSSRLHRPALRLRRSTSCRAERPSRCRRCARRSPATWSRAGARRPTARRSSRSDFARVVARRVELERDAMRRRGVNLTYLAFVARGDGRGAAEAPAC